MRRRTRFRADSRSKALSSASRARRVSLPGRTSWSDRSSFGPSWSRLPRHTPRSCDLHSAASTRCRGRDVLSPPASPGRASRHGLGGDVIALDLPIRLTRAYQLDDAAIPRPARTSQPLPVPEYGMRVARTRKVLTPGKADSPARANGRPLRASPAIMSRLTNAAGSGKVANEG